MQLRDSASKSYFENLIKNATHDQTTTTTTTTTTQMDGNTLSPIEMCFQKHMRKSMMFYETHRRKLESKRDASILACQRHFAERMQKEQNDADNADEHVQMLKEQCGAEIESFRESFANSMCMLEVAYDAWLEEHAGVPKILPTRIDLVLEARDITFAQQIVQPTDSLVDIKAMIAELLLRRHDEAIASYGDDVRFALQSRFAASDDDDDDSDNSSAAASSSSSSSSSLRQEWPIVDEHQPVVQLANYQIEQGAKIIARGTVHFESDVPKPCVVDDPDFETNKTAVDYFSCQECKINWVCRGCVDTCHRDRGHTVVPHLMAHRPNWRCCYCRKKRKCQKNKKAK
jgi:hypothetical protein